MVLGNSSKFRTMFVRTEHLFPPPTESATKPSVKRTCDGCRMEVFIDSDVELQDSEFPVKLVLEPLKITSASPSASHKTVRERFPSSVDRSTCARGLRYRFR